LDEVVLGDGPLKVSALGEEEGVDGLGEGVDVGGNDDSCTKIASLFTII